MQTDQEKNARGGTTYSAQDLLHTYTVIGLQITPVATFFTLFPCIFSQKCLQQLKEKDTSGFAECSLSPC